MLADQACPPNRGGNVEHKRHPRHVKIQASPSYPGLKSHQRVQSTPHLPPIGDKSGEHDPSIKQETDALSTSHANARQLSI